MQNPATPPRSNLAKGAIAVLALAVLALGITYAIRANRDAGGASGGGGQGEAEAAGPTFLNARAGVGYTGTAACARCHEDQHASWRTTNHSRSLAPLDPDQEPLPATMHHETSDLHYRVYAQDGTMRIEEKLLLDGDEAVVLADHAVKYLIGSGAHSRSYLVELDGFLCEAPVTWYTRKKAWDISPGYDARMHRGFSRPAGEICISCHVGRVEVLDHSVHRMRLHETAIGCERCHGPGALHAELHGRAEKPPAGDDLTIADPKIMTREQEIAVCAQCHMDHTLTVENPGKHSRDWRPGMPWNEVMVTYRLTAGGDPEMSVVGHVDQLRASGCFQGAKRMTCTTCHDPHGRAPVEPAARKKHFNGKCLDCHEHCARIPDEGPGIVEPEGDDCTRCHMPTSKTDAPHIVFTHHRIAVHGLTWKPPENRPPLPELEPLGDVSHLPQAVRDRNLGIAYLLLTGRQPFPVKVYGELRRRAHQLLEGARSAGLEDPVLEAAMARLYLDANDRQRATEQARKALSMDEERSLRADRRAECLVILVEHLIAESEFGRAETLLDELRTLRREAADELLRVELLRLSGRAAEAAAAARRAVAIWPGNPDVQYRAAEALGEAGDKSGQAHHGRIGTRLHKHLSAGRPPGK